MNQQTQLRPQSPPTTDFPEGNDPLLHRAGDWVWVPLRGVWRDLSNQPEELVRQSFIRHLRDELGYSLQQMAQEQRTTHGHQSPRVDIVVWESVEEKTSQKSPCLIVECKNEAVEISVKDYFQGESYARAVGCEFLVCTNRRHTYVFKLVPGAPGQIVGINEIPRCSDWANEQRLQEIRQGLRAFNRSEFQNLLFDCHNILRDVHKMEPGRAFDTISKILFIKMYVERSGRYGTFSVDFLNRRAETTLTGDPPLHEALFEGTKQHYQSDDLFAESDPLDVTPDTFLRIVSKLERFNLSETSDDVKGIAFEQFLGTTFRGELGQHFTPRPVVDFMIGLLDPSEGELICDPAAGSGGFLIKAFEHVRSKIQSDVEKQKDLEREAIENRDYSEDEKLVLIDEAFRRLNLDLVSTDDENNPADTRVGRLAWNCVFGCDAEPRAARTAKMNMIMHGDGHGGIHYHDGLVDFEGIFPDRFDVVVTNPPFGSNVGADQTVGGSDSTQVTSGDAHLEQGRARYGELWVNRHRQMLDAATKRTRILDLYETGVGKNNRPTETLFVERCLKLLKPGGRMGIVLPDGNLNNPSLSWLRRWCEGKARLLAVVSLPEETFHYSKTTAKTSIVFMRRFDKNDEVQWEAAWNRAHLRVDPHFNYKREELCKSYETRILTADNYSIATALSSLISCGVRREPIQWISGGRTNYPRGIGATKIAGNRKWLGNPSGSGAKSTTAALKRGYRDSIKGTMKDRARFLLNDLRSKMKDLDQSHNQALWAAVREEFDYPVFVSSPKSVGISAGGDDTLNELPDVLSEYRRYRESYYAGAL